MAVDDDPWEFVRRWYAEQCNGDWEHEFGIRIATLDNPGWTFTVDLAETDLEGRVLEQGTLEPGEGRWIWSRSDGRTYESSCDPLSVNDAFRRFRAFAEGDPVE